MSFTSSNRNQRRATRKSGAVLHDSADRLRRRHLVVVISDLIDDVSKIANGLQHFRHNGHKVLVF